MSDSTDTEPQCICRYSYRLFHGQQQEVRSHNPRCPKHGRPNPFKLVPAPAMRGFTIPPEPCCGFCTGELGCADAGCPCHGRPS
jgi:hypothetical protein